MFSTFLAILMIGSLAAIIFLIYSERTVEQNAIAALAPGIYALKSEIDNPFIGKYDYVRVYEVKDGWVRYSFTRADRSADASAMRSTESDRFNRLYARVQ